MDELTVSGPDGLIVVTNSVINDIHFTSEVHGSFNVTRALAWAEKHAILVESPMDLDMVGGMLSKMDVDPARMKELRLQLIEGRLRLRPLLSVQLDNDEYFIIDGYHRLKLLHECKAPKIVSYGIAKQHREQFRVRYYRENDGKRVEIGNLDVLSPLLGKFNDTQGRPR